MIGLFVVNKPDNDVYQIIKSITMQCLSTHNHLLITFVNYIVNYMYIVNYI
jgi:hypothetical protein